MAQKKPPLANPYGGRCGLAGAFCGSAAPDGYCTAHHCTYLSDKTPSYLCRLNDHECVYSDPSGQCTLQFCVRHTARFPQST